MTSLHISRARPLLPAALALVLAACASSGGLQPQGRLLDAGSLHSSIERCAAIASSATINWDLTRGVHHKFDYLTKFSFIISTFAIKITSFRQKPQRFLCFLVIG